MPSNPKLYIPNGVHFVTFRTEEGLPFVAADHIKVILRGILARATEKYAVSVCHYVWMANHVHFIVVVHDPVALADFIGFVKTESSHAINRLLGRRRKTVWCAGSDAPVLLTVDSVIDKIAYIYANPGLADLVDRIEDYPMLSSWEAFDSGRLRTTCAVITRDSIPNVGPRHLSLRHQAGFARSLETGAEFQAVFTLAPNAWIRCFKELNGVSTAHIKKQIIELIRVKEEIARRQRVVPVRGELALRTQDMDVAHQPEKFGRKSICVSSEREPRFAFVAWAKGLFHQARQVYALWKAGDFAVKFPPGLFAPRLPRLANLIPPLI